jgi:hypothetical protein
MLTVWWGGVSTSISTSGIKFQYILFILPFFLVLVHIFVLGIILNKPDLPSGRGTDGLS